MDKNTNCDSCNSCNYCYYCNYSKGLRMSENMLFCLGKGNSYSEGEGYQKNYRVFNKDVEKKEWKEIRSSVSGIKISFLPLIKKEDMTADEKKNYPVYKEIGGYLKKISYEDAWANWWNSASQEERNKILNIKYFDAAIFKEITGIDVATKSLTL